MRHRIVALAATVVAAGFAFIPGAPRALATDSADCTNSSWIGGETLVCGGSLVYRDYVYDDYGANTGVPGSSTGGLSAPAGDQRYATAADTNTADIVKFSLAVAGDHLHATFELNALFHPDSTIAAVAIDSDHNPSTGGGEWNDLDVSSTGWDQLAEFRTGDPATNIIEGDMPLPPLGRWRVQAVAAQADGTVMNVAFRGTQEAGNWWEDNQAAVLQSGDISSAGADVDATPSGFANGPANVLEGGHTFERIYTSAYTIGAGEGMTYDGVHRDGTPGTMQNKNDFSQLFHFLGKYQPYGLYVPPTDGPHGLQLVMHGYSANHASLMRQLGMTMHVGGHLDRVLLNPLGRGPAGWYSSYSERDVLDAMADVEANYSIDRDREFSGGYSMGGYGTFRFAELFPDRFAGYTAWVGFTGDCLNGTPLVGSCPVGANGNVIKYVDNLNNVPGSMMYSGADELVWAPSGLAMGDAFAATQNQYKWFFHPVAEHLTYALLDDWQKETQYTAGLHRVSRPPHIHFTTNPTLDAPELGIVHDKAYWVSALVTTGGDGTVDITSSGCGGSYPVTEEVKGFGTDPVPWISREGVVRGQQQVGTGNILRGTLTGVSSFTVDTAGACLDPGAVMYDLTTDGPATIHLSDGRSVTLPAAGSFAGELPGT